MGIKLKRSSVAAKAPVVGDLELGELAVNTYDGKLYLKKNDGSEAIVEVTGFDDTRHGSRAGGALHAAATTSVAGFLSSADKTKLDGVSSGADVTGAAIHDAAVKTTPVDADTIGLIDSAASNVLKKLSWANLKVTLKPYFDTLYVVPSQTQGTWDTGINTTESSITAAKLKASILTHAPAGLPAPTAGDIVILRLLGSIAFSNATISYSSNTQAGISDSTGITLGCTVVIAGTIRVKGEHARNPSDARTSYFRVLKNGTQVQEWSTTSTTYQARSVDVSVAVGDNITVQQRTSNSTSSSDWRNLTICSGVSTPAVS
jgi:hypothetical protein